jgi:hypothetical protein
MVVCLFGDVDFIGAAIYGIGRLRNTFISGKSYFMKKISEPNL